MLAEDLRMLSYLMNLTLACLTESEGNSLWEHFIWFKKKIRFRVFLISSFRD